MTSRKPWRALRLLTTWALAVHYEASNIVSDVKNAKERVNGDKSKTLPAVTSDESLASKLTVGMRIPSVKVLSQSDARPWHFQELLPSNGAWRIVLFAGDVRDSEQKQRLQTLCDRLSEADSLLRRFTPADGRYDSVIEVLTVHAASRTELTIFDFPEVLRPYDEVDGWDYNKIYVDDLSYHEGHGQIYEEFGIDRTKGCAVVLRPDQYISYIGPLDDYESMDKFFSAFMIPQATSSKGNIVVSQ